MSQRQLNVSQLCANRTTHSTHLTQFDLVGFWVWVLVLVSVLACVLGLQRLGNLFALWLMRQSNADTEAIYKHRYRYRAPRVCVALRLRDSSDKLKLQSLLCW